MSSPGAAGSASGSFSGLVPAPLASRRWSIDEQGAGRGSALDDHDDADSEGSGGYAHDDLADPRNPLSLLPRPLGHDHPLLSAPGPEEGAAGSVTLALDAGPANHAGPLALADQPAAPDPAFDIDTFLLSRLPQPLPAIQAELRGYLGTLKTELSALINEDYEEFIGMGIGLRGEGGRLEALGGPLEGLRGEVEDITSTLTESHTTLAALLASYADLRNERRLLEVLLGIDERIARVEGLLGVRSPGGGNSGAVNGVGNGQVDGAEDESESEYDSDSESDVAWGEDVGRHHPEPANGSSRVRILDEPAEQRSANAAGKVTAGPSLSVAPAPDPKMVARIASEYTQLRWLVDQARKEGCAYVEAVEERMHTIRTTLHSKLAALLRQTIRALPDERARPSSAGASRDASRTSERSRAAEDAREQLRECLKVYDAVEGWREAEDVVREFMKEDLVEIITLTALTIPPEPSVPQTPFPLSIKTPTVNSTGSGNPFSPALATPITPATGRPTQPNVFDMALQNATNGDGQVVQDSAPASDDDSEWLDEAGNLLARLLNRVLGLLRGRYLDVLDVADSLKVHKARSAPALGAEAGQSAEAGNDGEDDPLRRFQFLANVYWVELADRIVSEIGSVLFAAGRVSELHRNYTTTHHFIERLESLSPSLQGVLALRSHPAYAAFERRWQLPVYFQLRWKEIVGDLEERLQVGQGGLAGEKGSDGFMLPQTAAALNAIRSCWSPDVYIPELSNRFWRLTLQIINRYRSWLERAAAAVYENANLSVPQGSSGRTSMTLNRSGTPQLGSSSPALGSGGDPASDPAAAAAEENLLKVASAVSSDLARMISALRQAWREEIKPATCNGADEEGAEELEDTITSCLTSLEELRSAPNRQIQSILVRRCTEVLKLVRSIASAFRAAPPKSKTDPIVPSHFVPNILRPLKDYFKRGGYGDSLKDEYGQAWSRAVIQEVVASYTNILVTVRKTEDLVRRVRKNKKSGFSLFGSSSTEQGLSAEEEDERFKKQMLADVDAMGDDAKALGIVPEAEGDAGVSGWSGLKDVITREVLDQGGS